MTELVSHCKDKSPWYIKNKIIHHYDVISPKSFQRPVSPYRTAVWLPGTSFHHLKVLELHSPPPTSAYHHFGGITYITITNPFFSHNVHASHLGRLEVNTIAIGHPHVRTIILSSKSFYYLVILITICTQFHYTMQKNSLTNSSELNYTTFTSLTQLG